MRKLDREVSFYHYGWRTPRVEDSGPNFIGDDLAIPSTGDPNNFTGPVEPNPASPKHTHGLAAHYFHKKSAPHLQSLLATNNFFGHGLYAGLEPIVSVGYSAPNDAGVLLKIDVPKGVNYLNLRNERIHPELPNVVAVPLLEAELFWCAIKNVCRNKNCADLVYDRWQRIAASGKPFLDPSQAVKFPELIKQARDVYGDLKIGFVNIEWGRYEYSECRLNTALHSSASAVFVDPKLASQVKLSFLVPALEGNPSSSKRTLYEEVLEYFDAVDLEKWQPMGAKYVEFLKYYGRWAGSLRNLPSSTLMPKYQKHRYQSWKDPVRRNKMLTHKIFSCDAKFINEFR